MERTGYDKARRLLNLLAYLQGGARRPADVLEHVYGLEHRVANLSATPAPYATQAQRATHQADRTQREAAEKSFRRDRDDLRELGYEIATHDEVVSLTEHVVPIELGETDMTLLAMAMSTFSGDLHDHKTVTSTVRKLLAGSEVHESDVHLRVNVSHLPTILSFAHAMSASIPLTVTYSPTSSAEPRTYEVRVMSLFYRSGHYYAACELCTDNGAEEEPGTIVNLKMCRISSVTLNEPSSYRRIPTDEESFTPFAPASVTITGDPAEIGYLAERGRLEGSTIELDRMDFVDALVLLSDLGTRATTDHDEYLSRLEHLASLS